MRLACGSRHHSAPPATPRRPSGNRCGLRPQGFEREDIKHREELKHQKSQHKKLLSAIEKDVKKQGEMNGEVMALQQDVPRLKSECDALTATISKEEAELEAQ